MSSSCVSIPRVLPLWSMASSTTDHRGGTRQNRAGPSRSASPTAQLRDRGRKGLGTFHEQKWGVLRERAQPAQKRGSHRSCEHLPWRAFLPAITGIGLQQPGRYAAYALKVIHNIWV